MFSENNVLELASAVDYAANSIVSKTLVNQKAGTLTLFAFDQGQSLSEHTAPFDALAIVIDGTGVFSIGGKRHRVQTGQIVRMPAQIPHAVNAEEKFKMLLIMIRSTGEKSPS